MIDYQGNNYGGAADFSAQPRVVQKGTNFRDPYGMNIQEYYPQNISHDRRVQRGNTYAAMVIPAGTNPDAMVMEKQQEDQRRQFKRSMPSQPSRKNIYPNRDIATPEPVPGRAHIDIQTEKYVEQLTDKPPESEAGVATEFYLDRPPVPLFQPRMPSKENCKDTQIYDGDPDLFDFNREIEPMLNVLCGKTLEQARMEVLEEEEYKIMKIQQKEYEEIRNAELIEAQRYEAAELRFKQENQRRLVQQKARKLERKSAHQKFVARVLAKKHLQHLRVDSIRCLQENGMIGKPIEKVLHMDVLPWLYTKMHEFLGDEEIVQTNSSELFHEGILQVQNNHAKHLQDKKDQKKQAELDVIKQHQDKLNQKQQRKIAREKRAKDLQLQKLKDEIRKLIVDKGDVKTPLSNNDLLDITGNYEKKQFFGALGGHLQQIYLVLESMKKLAKQDLSAYWQKRQQDPSSDSLKKPQNTKELLIEHFLLQFLVQYLKEIKNDNVQIQLSSKILNYLDSIKIGINELHKLQAEQLAMFRYLFVEERNQHPVYAKNSELMDKLLSLVCLIITKKVPVDAIPYKIDIISQKFKLVSIPKGVEVADRVEVTTIPAQGDEPERVEETNIQKNTNEKALIRICIPKKRETTFSEAESQRPQTNETNRVSNADGDRLVEMDQDEKGLAISARGLLPYSVHVIHHAAARAHRSEVMQSIQKQYPDFFTDNNLFNDVLQLAEENAMEIEEEYIRQNCNDYVMPCIDYHIHAPEYE